MTEVDTTGVRPGPRDGTSAVPATPAERTSWRARAADAVFPWDRPMPVPPVLAVAGYLLVFAGFVAALLFRQVGPSPLTTFYAEDGTFFYGAAISHPLGQVLLTPYAGYAHLVPRLSAEVVARLPVHLAAAGFTAIAVALTAACALFVYRASSGHLPAVPVRAALAALVVLLPLASFETVDNVANIHSYLLFAAFFALLWRPRGWPGCLLAALVVVLAVDSDPLSFALAPLALVRLTLLRRVRDQVVSVAYVGAAVLQAVVSLGGHRPINPPPSAADLAATYAVHVGLGAFGGITDSSAAWADIGWPAVAAALALVVGALALALWRGGPARWLALAAVAVSLVVFAVPARISWDPRWLPVAGEANMLGTPRYDVVPALLLLTALAAGLGTVITVVVRRTGRGARPGAGSRPARRGAGRSRRASGGRASGGLASGGLAMSGLTIGGLVVSALVGVLTLGIVADFRLPNERSPGPTWAQGLAAAARHCHGKLGDTMEQVQITPRLLVWKVPLTCRQIRTDSTGPEVTRSTKDATYQLTQPTGARLHRSMT